MAKKSFETKLITYDISGAWTFLKVPFSVEKEYGTRGRVQVKGSIDEVPFKNTLLPAGKGEHQMVVKKAVRGKIGKEAGDKVSVVMEVDKSKRVVRAPRDLRNALSENPAAEKTYKDLAYSHKKAYVEWIKDAKKSETRERRVSKAVSMLAEGKKLK